MIQYTVIFKKTLQCDKNFSSLGTRSGSLSILEDQLEPGQEYQLQLAGYNPFTSTTYTKINFATTRPPYGGTCSISPSEGWS